MNKETLLLELKKIGLLINENTFAKISDFCNFLILENKKTNLTAIKELEEIYLKHVYDSLTLSQGIDLNRVESLLDIGSGAGFPGIVIKIVFPQIKVTLLDSNNKKTTFLHNAIKRLGLETITVVTSRAEEYILKNRETYDLVTARAVSELRIIAELAIPYVKVGGIFIAMKGKKNNEEMRSGVTTAEILNSNLSGTQEFLLPVEKSERTLYIFNKLKPTPKEYPRSYDRIVKNSLKKEPK